MAVGDFQQRIDAVRDRADIAAVIGAAVKLSRGKNPRGKCPFHGSKSDSLAIYSDSGRARCWGCGWSGDAIRFVQDHYGLGFTDALERLEADHGLGGLEAKPVKREKRIQYQTGREPISSAEMGRILWEESVVDRPAIATYLASRGVPTAALYEYGLVDLHFHPNAPISAWVEGCRDRVATAPAMLARVRSLVCERGADHPDQPDRRFGEPQAVHATFLAPDLSGKMERYDGRGEPLPARKFLGSVGGGGVLFAGEIPVLSPGSPLFVAEGVETLLSGMALLEVPPEAIGIAVLSLDNLQGGWLGIGKRRSLPLYDPQPDPDRLPVCFAHDGPVTGLIDADMKPIPARVIEHPGLAAIERRLSSAERSQLCAALFARAWRNAGCRRVRAVRPPMGLDFNDVAAGRSSATFRCSE